MSQTHLKMLVGSGYGLHFAGCLGCFLPAVRVLALGKPVFGGKTMAGEKSRALMVDTPRSTDGGHSEVNRPGLYRHTCSPGSLTWDLRTTAPTLSQRSGQIRRSGQTRLLTRDKGFSVNYQNVFHCFSVWSYFPCFALISFDSYL